MDKNKKLEPPHPNKCIWFGFAGYPEIQYIRLELTADTRPGRFVGYALCAQVVVGDWRGIVCYKPGTEESLDLYATYAYAATVVDYQRRKQAGAS